MHNALNQVELECKPYTLKGFSFSGLATYIQIPELDLCFDMGECPLSAIGLNHVFLSHAHGDHSRCLLRHYSLRKMMGVQSAPVYYMPTGIVENAKKWIEAECVFEGVKPQQVRLPHLVGVKDDQDYIPFEYRKDLYFKSFTVKHSVESIGFTVYHHKKKLKEQYLNLGSKAIIAAKEKGEEIQHSVYSPVVTFIGDCLGISLKENTHIFDSRIVIIECTFLLDDELQMAKDKGHTHIKEIAEALKGQKIQAEYIVLKHFSLKYSREVIKKTVDKYFKGDLRSKIKLFIK